MEDAFKKLVLACGRTENLWNGKNVNGQYDNEVWRDRMRPVKNPSILSKHFKYRFYRPGNAREVGSSVTDVLKDITGSDAAHDLAY